MIICLGKTAQAPEVSRGSDGEVELSEAMVQLRLYYLLLALEKIFFKWKQMERANGRPAALGLFFPINQG